MPIFRAPAFALARSIPPHTAQVSAASRTVATSGYGLATGTTGSVTASALGGSGSFSYSWACTNGWSANSAGSATTTFTSPAISHGVTSTATATVTVTDLMSGATSQASVSLSHERSLAPLSWSMNPFNQQVFGSEFPSAIVRGVWTVSGTDGSGNYSYSSSFIPTTTPITGGASGDTLDVTFDVPYGTNTGGIWIIDITDNVTGQSLHLERGMTFTNQS